MVRQERTWSAGLLLCNDTEQGRAELDDPSAGIRVPHRSRAQPPPSLLCSSDRWQQEKGARYSFSIIEREVRRHTPLETSILVHARLRALHGGGV
jgi:hypothetical protein